MITAILNQSNHWTCPCVELKLMKWIIAIEGSNSSQMFLKSGIEQHWFVSIADSFWFFSSYRGHIEIHSKVRGRQHIRRVHRAGLVVSGGKRALGIACSWHLHVPYLFECKLRPGWTKLRKSRPIQLRSMRQCRTTRIWTQCYPSVPVAMTGWTAQCRSLWWSYSSPNARPHATIPFHQRWTSRQ